MFIFMSIPTYIHTHVYICKAHLYFDIVALDHITIELSAAAIKNCTNIKKCIENVDDLATKTGKYFSSRPDAPF